MKNCIYKKMFIFISWIVLGVFSLLIFSLTNNYIISNLYLSVIFIIHGIFYFIVHSNKKITPISLIMLFSVLLIGFPSLYLTLTDYYTITHGHYIALLICYYCQVMMYSVFFEKYRDKEINTQILQINKAVTRSMKQFCIIIVIVSFGIGALIPGFSIFKTIGIYDLIVLLTIFIVLKSNHLNVNNIILVTLMMLFYYFFVFEKFGRINLVTLVISILMILNLKIKHLNVKVLVSLLFYPFIIFGAYLRSGELFDLSKGVGSIVSPFYRFGQLIELYMNNELVLKFGYTIYSAFVAFIPRSIWQSKPYNFNREITYIFTPEYVKFGHSEASILHAEILFNFGFIGLLTLPFIFGWLISKLEKSYLNLLNKRVWNLKNILQFLIVVILTSGQLNFLWGGFSTFINRDVFRLMFIIGIYFLYTFIFKRRLR